MKPATPVPIHAVAGRNSEKREDLVAVEEPMEIRVGEHSIAVTMRTPGNDFELAAGFLFTEGVVTRPEELKSIRHCAGSNFNVVRVELNAAGRFDPARLSRHVFTSSSCGMCGKKTLEQVRAVMPGPVRRSSPPSSETLYLLPQRLREGQNFFATTGGMHAAALFDRCGEPLLVREDVGRHNATDKLVGALLLKGSLPAHDTLILVSGRASFELVQKAAMAGIPTLAAVGAPSSLAIELARECGMTLIGFLRDGRYNIYTGEGGI